MSRQWPHRPLLTSRCSAKALHYYFYDYFCGHFPHRAHYCVFNSGCPTAKIQRSSAKKKKKEYQKISRCIQYLSLVGWGGVGEKHSLFLLFSAVRGFSGQIISRFHHAWPPWPIVQPRRLKDENGRGKGDVFFTVFALVAPTSSMVTAVKTLPDYSAPQSYGSH